MTTKMLRPSQFPTDGTMRIDGEKVVGIQYVKGGVRISTETADGSFRSFRLNGRRKYRAEIDVLGCTCMSEDPGDGFGERVVEHGGDCRFHPENDR